MCVIILRFFVTWSSDNPRMMGYDWDVICNEGRWIQNIVFSLKRIVRMMLMLLRCKCQLSFFSSRYIMINGYWSTLMHKWTWMRAVTKIQSIIHVRMNNICAISLRYLLMMISEGMLMPIVFRVPRERFLQNISSALLLDKLFIHYLTRFIEFSLD